VLARRGAVTGPLVAPGLRERWDDVSLEPNRRRPVDVADADPYPRFERANPRDDVAGAVDRGSYVPARLDRDRRHGATVALRLPPGVARQAAHRPVIETARCEELRPNPTADEGRLARLNR